MTMTIIHIIEMSTGSYDDYSETVLGAVFDEAEANAIVAAHEKALKKGREHLDNPKVDATALRDAENMRVYTYPIEMNAVPKAPVLAYITYSKGQSPIGDDRYGEVKAAFFDPETGADVTHTLMPTQIPPVEVVQAAVLQPQKAYPYEAKAYHLRADSTVREDLVTMYISRNLKAVLKAAGKN